MEKQGKTSFILFPTKVKPFINRWQNNKDASSMLKDRAWSLFRVYITVVVLQVLQFHCCEVRVGGASTFERKIGLQPPGKLTFSSVHDAGTWEQFVNRGN